MNEVTITVQINKFWVDEQLAAGKDAFADIVDTIVDKFSYVSVDVTYTVLKISHVNQEDCVEIRSLIKNFLKENYNMQIENGDYRLLTNVAPKKVSLFEDEDLGFDIDSLFAGSDDEDEEDDDDEYDDEEDSDGTDDKYLVKIPQLEDLLDEYDTVIKHAMEFCMYKVVWSSNILLSIDDGNGISTISKKIAALYEKNHIVYKDDEDFKSIIEYRIPGKSSTRAEYFKIMFKDIKNFSPCCTAKNISTDVSICYIDLSECYSEIDSIEMRDILKTLSDLKKNFLYIFRIPYVNQNEFDKVKNVLSDIFVIKPLIIPPYSTEELVSYLKIKLENKSLVLDDNIDEFLEKLIIFEKRDGRFNGLKTINRLSDDIIYHKLAQKDTEFPVTLSLDDLMGIYADIKSDDVPAEVLLEELCGMQNVKQTINEIVAQIQAYKQLKDSGKKLSAPTMHMRFVGSPGTGKTTVARLVARMFKEKGIIEKGYFYEIKARNLCGRYIGETAPKTSAYCRDALGSVLFIDEAYTLYRNDTDRDYGKEAIDTLITEMENHRDNLVVIMAGYKNEMDKLMTANPGLESRMPYEITFNNYSREELIKIFYSMLGDNFTYTDEFDSALRNFINSIPDSAIEKETFGNARLIRNLYERIWSKAAFRNYNSNISEIILQKEDLERAVSEQEFKDLFKDKKIKIGF